MYRKIGLIVCAWTLAWVMGNGVFAGDTTPKVNMANTIEILKPEVGSEGDVVLKKDILYVNLRLSGKSVVYMSLHRIDPEFYLGSQLKDDGVSASGSDFEKMSDDQKLNYRRMIFAKKNALEAEYNSSRSEYDTALAAVKKTFGDVNKMEALKASGTMTPVQQALMEKFRQASGALAQSKKDYVAVKGIYDKVFSRLIFGPTEVKPTDVLLTYQTEIQGVKPGTYVLAFSEKADGSQIIKTLEFKGETSEKTVEKMLETLPENRSKLFTGPTQ